MALARRDSNLVFMHHRKTGELEIRRDGEFYQIPKSPSTPLQRHLHYTNEHRRRVCRCSHSLRHKKSFLIASESKHLAANLTRYLDHRSLEACSMADFRASDIQQQADWASEGIFVDKFHYATRQKDVACRCTKPNNHSRGTVRNPEIVELCVHFFRKNVNKMTCTKAQWRGTPVPSHQGSSAESDSFKYDSKPMHNLLRKRERSDYDAAPLTPHLDMADLCSGPNGEPDLPKQVWESGRPIMWGGRRGSATSCSTPLGTAASPKFPVDSGLDISGDGRPASIRYPQRASVATIWSNVQRDAAGQAPDDLPVRFEKPLTARRIDNITPLIATNADDQKQTPGLVATPDVKPAPRGEIPNRAIVELRDSMFSSTRPEETAEPPVTHRVELSTHQEPMNLPPSATQGYAELSGCVPRPSRVHSATLRDSSVRTCV
jgi:hypothetical protein